MKGYATLFGLFLLVYVSTNATNAQSDSSRQEITKGKIRTLINTQSERLSILGLHISMTEKEAKVFLEKSKNLFVEYNPNPVRIYVYERAATGDKGKALLTLIWDGQATMKTLVVLEGLKSYLNADFKKLFTLEALDENSQFTKNFIGKPDRAAVTANLSDLKVINYYFDKIGLILVRRIEKGKDEYVGFGLVPSKPRV